MPYVDNLKASHSGMSRGKTGYMGSREGDEIVRYMCRYVTMAEIWRFRHVFVHVGVLMYIWRIVCVGLRKITYGTVSLGPL